MYFCALVCTWKVRRFQDFASDVLTNVWLSMTVFLFCISCGTKMLKLLGTFENIFGKCGQ